MNSRPAHPSEPTSPLRLLLATGLLLPVAYALVAELLAPTVATVRLSLQEANPMGASEWVGTTNYSALLQNAPFLSAVGFSISMALERLVVVGVVPALLGLGAAALGRGSRRVLRLVFTIPIAIYVPAVIAVAWRTYLAPDGALQSAQALAQPGTARMAVLLVDALAVGALASGLGLVFYLAAQRRASTAGEASSARPILVVWGVSLAAALASGLQAFTISHLLTGGGPAFSTRTWMLAVFQEAFQRMAFGPGAAASCLLLLPLMLLSFLAGLGVVLSGIGLDLAPERTTGETGPRSGLRYLALAVGLLGGLGAGAVALVPLVSALGRGVDGESLNRLQELAPVGRTLANTLVPLLAGVFLVQLPLAYAGALAIGALRPLGRWSELLLLPFSPWLLVGVGPLAIALFQEVRAGGSLGTLPALVPPVALSVPLLFMLTLFFRGRHPHWQARRRGGDSSTPAFLSAVILPSLPLALLLGLAAVFVYAGDLLWPLLVSVRPDSYPVGVALAQMAGQPGSGPLLAAGVTRLGLPLMVVALVLLVPFQVLYLDRLRVGVPEERLR